MQTKEEETRLARRQRWEKAANPWQMPRRLEMDPPRGPSEGGRTAVAALAPAQ
jgi:hypothetical protein